MTDTLTSTVQAIATQIAVSSAGAELHYADIRLSFYLVGIFLAAAVALLGLVWASSLRKAG